MDKKIVIFDLDGTLLDTIKDLAESANHALTEFGFPIHDIDAYKKFAGNGIAKLIERALPETARDESTIRRVKSAFTDYYNLHNADYTAPYAGIKELLENLHQDGILMAVASNKYHEATVKLIGRYFPGTDFTSVMGQREGIATKPDPHIIDEITSHAGCKKENCIYVGDSCVDMQTGINAGVRFCGVLWGFRDKSELEAYHPSYIAENPHSLYGFLAENLR